MSTDYGSPTETCQGLAGMLRYAWRRSLGSISLAMVCVCTGCFVALAALEVFHLVSRSTAMVVLGLSYTGAVERHWLWQFMTAPLMHANGEHLVFNMLSLWLLGPGIEKTIGRGRYLILTILSLACSMGGFLLFAWGTGNIVVGYSGVIFGLLVAQAMFFPNSIIAVYAFFPVKMKYAVLLMASVELYFTLSPDQAGVAHAAHLFGAVAAFLYLQLIRWRDSRRTAQVASRPALRRRARRKPPSDSRIPKEL